MYVVGYLMTQLAAQAASTFECVDSEPEYLRGMNQDTDGALFYFVKPDCVSAGTIGQCPPYKDDWQLTCVVCTI